jgi:hypothetical protein
METTAKESETERRSSLTPPRKERITEMYEVIDLARSQLRFASDPLVTEMERQRLCRAAAALLDHVLGQNHDSAEGRWVTVGEAARRVVDRMPLREGER